MPPNLRLSRYALLALSLCGFAPASLAQTISLNFIRASSGESPLSSSDVAGVVPAANWNNAPQVSADRYSGLALVDDRGAATGSIADWDSGSSSWSVGSAGSGSAADKLMMTGYLDQGGNGQGQIHTLNIDNIPYATYDVYLYHSSSGGPDRTARYRANGNDIFTRNLAPANAFNGFVHAGYGTLAGAALAAGNPAGNYVRWTGLSGTLTIEAEGLGDSDGGSGGDARRAPIQGIQIVATTVTPGLPEVENAAASALTATSATANGSLIDNGDGADLATLTFYWGTSDGGAVAGSWSNTAPAGTRSSPGAFSGALAGLAPKTTYFFRAAASNSAGTSWAASSTSFTTTSISSPSVVNLAPSGINGTFPGGSILAAGAYLVVAEDPATMVSHFDYSGALGPFANGTSLKNSGERITLRNPAGANIDEVTYKLGFPWPTVGDDIGSPLASPSIELINPLLDNDLGGSWRASGFPVTDGGSGGGGGAVTLLNPAQSAWRYRKGTNYPAQDGSGKQWWDHGYDGSADGAWLDGTTPVGYGDADDATILTDMQGSYLSIFLRKEFTIAAGQIPNSITLSCYHDDGAVVYLNGVEVERFSLNGGAIPFPPPEAFANTHEAAWSSSTLSGVSSYLVEGSNTIAIQCINDDLGSSDLSIDAMIVTNPAGAGGSNAPTPGAANSSFANNAPPQIRQVDHTPKQPASGQAVVVSTKITDPDDATSVSLHYQVVEPGDYFCRYLKFNNDGTPNADPRFEDPAEWTSVAMSDGGTGGDALAADSIYSVTLPASLQTNRRLIRYRITAGDTPGATITVPYIDDPQPNFAYFVYDGTPDWSGAIRPGDTAVTYPGSLLSSIPTYYLLSTGTWVDDSQFGGYTGSEYLWPGTMVYEGKVYDHIQYRPRGGVHRFDYGKNFWKFDFPRGHRFEARDRYGKRYATDWNKLNFSSIVQQVGFNHRGEQGLFEGVGFRLFELCGVPACKTHYTQFYVIDQASATGANQYEGDYYGLFLAIEQMDGQYLDQHRLPDGNLYKIEGNAGVSNN